MDPSVTSYFVIFVFAILCLSVLIKLMTWLLCLLSIHVNCWFCNKNSWVKWLSRNSWTCSKCEQYNGFDSEGNYNKPLNLNNAPFAQKLSRVTRSNRNGLCRICNINQHLKVMQLSNFVPVNEKKFDDEIEAYREQLEKSYKLCKPCQKVLKLKLEKDKEKILNANMRLSRSFYNHDKPQKKLVISQFIAALLVIFAFCFLIMSFYELYAFVEYKMLRKTVNKFFSSTKNLALKFLERHYEALRRILPDPSVSISIQDFEWIYLFKNMTIPRMHIPVFFTIERDNLLLTEKVLSGSGAILQLLVNIFKEESLTIDILIQSMWMMCLMSTFIYNTSSIMIIAKFSMALLLIISYKYCYFSTSKIVIVETPVKSRIISSAKCDKSTNNSFSVDESEDEASLKKFGVKNSSHSPRNLSDSFSVSASVKSGNGFKVPKVWSHNNGNSFHHPVKSMFNTYENSSFYPVQYPNKPSFNKYQSSNSDHSDIDEGLGCLSLGTKQKNLNHPGVFCLKTYNSMDSGLFRPVYTPLGRQLISPSRLVHGTQQSWVAGGYWGGEKTHNIFTSLGMSRSSSQSSGFESQVSVPHNLVNSPPPSRDDSVCSDYEKLSVFNEPNEWSAPQNNISPVFGNNGMYGNHNRYIKYNYSLHNPQSHFFSSYGQNEFCVQPCSLQRENVISPQSVYDYDQQSAISCLNKLPLNR